MAFARANAETSAVVRRRWYWAMLRRDLGLSGYEYADGVMTGNLIASLGRWIYLNRAANSVIRHNTLIGTLGIDARYPETIAGWTPTSWTADPRARRCVVLADGMKQVAGRIFWVAIRRRVVRRSGAVDLRCGFACPRRHGTEPICAAPPGPRSRRRGAFKDFSVCANAAVCLSDPSTLLRQRRQRESLRGSSLTSAGSRRAKVFLTRRREGHGGPRRK